MRSRNSRCEVFARRVCAFYFPFPPEQDLTHRNPRVESVGTARRYFQHAQRKAFSRLLLGLSVLAALLVASTGRAQSYVAPKRVVTVKITEVTPANDQPACDAWHFYLKTWIGGTRFPLLAVPFSFDGSGGTCEAFSYGPESFTQLNHTWSERLACDTSPIPVRIELWEADNVSDDDKEATLAFEVDPKDPSTFSGCHDDGGNGGFCWEVEIQDPGSADSDGDGLLDEWELHGYDANCDGEMVHGEDVLLPQLGVNPNHKDLLIEMSWFLGYEPSEASVAEVRQAFALAPVGAGGTENPDGTPGINLIIDAGEYVDPVTGNQVGNNLGIHARGGPNLGDPAGGPGQPFKAPANAEELLELVSTLQTSQRRGLFRYVLHGPIWSNELGGVTSKDVVYLDRLDPAALMHELGHSLGLQHGGDENHNCKPNHLSIMNYRMMRPGGCRGAIRPWRLVPCSTSLISRRRGSPISRWPTILGSRSFRCWAKYPWMRTMS